MMNVREINRDIEMLKNKKDVFNSQMQEDIKMGRLDEIPLKIRKIKDLDICIEILETSKVEDSAFKHFLKDLGYK